MALKTKYSDEELNEFRTLIEEKLSISTHEYEEMMDVLRHRNGNDVVDEMPTYKLLEEGSSVQTKEELTNQAMRMLKFINGLKAALVRIENKTYGICRITGKLIPAARLRAVPHATTSIEGKMMEKGNKTI